MMAAEPAQPRAPRAPDLGWPPILIRVEFARPMEISEAAYWLAYHSRRNGTGAVANLAGRDLYAWPHQPVEDIVHTHLRLEEIAHKVEIAGRWHPSRKLELVRAVLVNLVDRATAMARFSLSAHEMHEWETSYAPSRVSALPPDA